MFKSNSISSLNSERLSISNKRSDVLQPDSDMGSPSVYVEERVKLLKNSQYHHIYRSIKELCKQIKEFKTYMLMSVDNREDLADNKANLRKQLHISFEDEDEIHEIIKDDAFKINTRSVLGVKNNNDWIYGLNIGNIMHLAPLEFTELQKELNEKETDANLLKELTNNSVLEKIILLAAAYFCIATEIRFIHQKGLQKTPSK